MAGFFQNDLKFLPYHDDINVKLVFLNLEYCHGGKVFIYFRKGRDTI